MDTPNKPLARASLETVQPQNEDHLHEPTSAVASNLAPARQQNDTVHEVDKIDAAVLYQGVEFLLELLAYRERQIVRTMGGNGAQEDEQRAMNPFDAGGPDNYHLPSSFSGRTAQRFHLVRFLRALETLQEGLLCCAATVCLQHETTTTTTDIASGVSTGTLNSREPVPGQNNTCTATHQHVIALLQRTSSLLRALHYSNWISLTPHLLQLGECLLERFQMDEQTDRNPQVKGRVVPMPSQRIPSRRKGIANREQGSHRCVSRARRNRKNKRTEERAVVVGEPGCFPVMQTNV